MVQVSPFRALRYNPSKISSLSQVICPPYDVISVPDYHRLLKRHPANIVRVELPLAQGKGDRYALAASVWNRLQRQRLVIPDKQPSFYGYEQRFTYANQAYVRRGFFGALRLEAPGKGHVRPHERTFPKHKEDRLLLMRATHANISPIFGIFDRKKKAQALLNDRMDEKPLATARDDKGVTHRLWQWSDETAIKTLSAILADEDVLIADGHHRYETAWNYAQSQGRTGARSAASFVTTFLCPLNDSGLVIQPTHRAVVWNGDLEEWKKRIGPDFDIQTIPSLKPLLTRLRSSHEDFSLAFISGGGIIWWLKAKPGKKQRYALPVMYLHEHILKDVPLENISYTQDARQIIQSIQRGEANVAFLLPPPDKEVFARICRGGQLLPQKSTYFYPKIATGFVMRSLVKDVV